MKIKLYKKQLLFSLTLTCILLFSCKNDVNQIEDVRNTSNEKEIQLIKKLENPYSVKNMRLALQNLTGVSTKSSSTPTFKASIVNGVNNITDANDDINDIITTTHYYLKFKPKNEEELDLIKKDTTLFWFDYPLDYEISDGDTYHDPEVPEGKPTYQYTYASVNHELPIGVEYEIIEDLFIPEEEDENDDANIADNYLTFEEQIAIQQKMTKVKQSVTLNTTQNISLLEALENEALSITNNNDETNSNDIKITGWFSRPSKWYPSGYIKVSDTELGTIPIEGVKIRFGRWFKWRSDITDSKGYYRSGSSFRRSVRYKMDWERYHFALRDGGFSSAQHSGPYKKGSWD